MKIYYLLKCLPLPMQQCSTVYSKKKKKRKKKGKEKGEREEKKKVNIK